MPNYVLGNVDRFTGHLSNVHSLMIVNLYGPACWAGGCVILSLFAIDIYIVCMMQRSEEDPHPQPQDFRLPTPQDIRLPIPQSLPLL